MIVTNIPGTLKTGKVQTGFYMNGYLVSNLLGVSQYLKQEWDCVGVFSGNGRVRIGKTQVKGSKVLMADGSWKNVEDIKEGDEVISPNVKNGKYQVAKVVETHSRFCEDVYDVCNKNTNEILYSCADNHEIPIEYSISKHSNRKKFGYVRVLENIEAKDLAMKNKRWLRGNGVVSYQGFLVDKFNGIDNATIEPYSLGVYLGDGSSSNSDLQITCSSEEAMFEVSKHYPIMSILKHKKCNRYRFSVNSKLFAEIIRINLQGKKSGDKFIPDECKKSDSNYRLRLLAGLIDTDGYVNKKGIVTYTTKSLQLAKDIQEICRSLGGNTNIKQITKTIKSIGFSGKYYNVQINLGKLQTKIPLKKKFKINRLSLIKQCKNKIGICVNKSKPQMVYGFEIDGESHLYITDNWMVTHNSTCAFQVATFLAWMQAGGKLEMELVADGNKKTWKVTKLVHPTKPLHWNLKENVIFNAMDLQSRAQSLYEKYGKGQILVYDEGREGLDAKRAMENLNKTMEDFFQECGFMGHIIFIVLPNFFKLHEDYAVSRSIFLIDCFRDKKKRRGYYNFYSERQKEWLYFLGKKRVGITLKYGAASETFWGRFSSWFPFDRDEYNRLKSEALKKRKRSARQIAWKKQRDAVIYLLKTKTEDSNNKIADDITVASGIKITGETVQRIVDNLTKDWAEGD